MFKKVGNQYVLKGPRGGIGRHKGILLLGATAATAVLDHSGPLKEVRGQWKRVKILNNSFDVLTTFHPAFLLRQATQKKLALNDFVKLKVKLHS